MSCCRAEPGAIVLTVRLTPRADRDAVEGVGVLADGQAVALARVRALPEDGAANKALIALLAKTFRRPKSAIHITAGAGARVKHVRIAGEPADLAAIVESWSAEK
jgi:uncharacterized protein YggU (UPF0235/DUF167 family)